jgi:hypothetical protein
MTPRSTANLTEPVGYDRVATRAGSVADDPEKALKDREDMVDKDEAHYTIEHITMPPDVVNIIRNGSARRPSDRPAHACRQDAPGAV